MCVKAQEMQDQVILVFVNVQVSLGSAGCHHAAVDCDLRVSVLSSASRFCGDGCTPLYKMLVGLWWS